MVFFCFFRFFHNFILCSPMALRILLNTKFRFKDTKEDVSLLNSSTKVNFLLENS